MNLVKEYFKMKKVGLLIIATNKYTRFLQNLISSADDYFLKNQEVTYFIFTNNEVSIDSKREIVFTNVEHRDWPWMTLGRYRIFSNAENILNKMDYLYYCDVDMLFVDEVGDEILGDRVATQHPGYTGTRGTPDTNPQCLAYVGFEEEMQYFAGGFNGGTSDEYLKMSNFLANNIDIDYSRGIIAVWHDESHMNRYFIDNSPTVILSPSYCYPENVNLSYTKRLLALDKNHQEIRS